jgi:hypothetical protein
MTVYASTTVGRMSKAQHRPSFTKWLIGTPRGAALADLARYIRAHRSLALILDHRSVSRWTPERWRRLMIRHGEDTPALLDQLDLAERRWRVDRDEPSNKERVACNNTVVTRRQPNE